MALSQPLYGRNFGSWIEWCRVATIGRFLGRKRLCNQVFTCTTVAQLGALGIGTLQGQYSARKGSQVISALIPLATKPSTKRSVNISVPVPVRTVGNQMAGSILLFIFLWLYFVN